MGELKPKDLGLKKPFTEEMAKAVIAVCAEALRARNPEWADPSEVEDAERSAPVMWGEIKCIDDFREIIRGSLSKGPDADVVLDRAFDAAVTNLKATDTTKGKVKDRKKL